MDFKDQVVLITGAGKGAGRALAEAFATRAAIIAANDITPVNVDQVVADINSRGGKSRAYIEDVAKKLGVQALINNVEDDFGRIDILINHAAVEPASPLFEMDEWDWHRTLDVNLTGAFLMIQSVGRVMRLRGAGVILNLIMGPSRALQNGAGAYLASMGGLISLTQAAARELGAYGIRVHALGRGLREYEQAQARVPKSLLEAALYLCSAPDLNGQIVQMED
jgi:NAD(P)-dependent dehydrogenase (short-subunit alcohol dehydrogenase family)